MTVVVDYGVGNLFSLCCSLKAIDEQAVVSDDPQVILSAERVILPGVGAFQDAMDKLREKGLDLVVKEYAASGRPLLGICVGMQMMMEKDYEFGEHEGLGLIPGSVKPFAEQLKEPLDIPHMGWNALKVNKACPLFRNTDEGAHVYFVHSYAVFDCDDTAAVAEYGVPFAAAVWKDNVYGTQFHPEKSGPEGLKILKEFCRL